MKLLAVSLIFTFAVSCGSAQAERATVEWVRQIVSISRDESFSVAVDAAGNSYISGRTYGSLGNANAGGADAFLMKFDSSGHEVWAAQIGTIGIDQSEAVAVDAAGNAYITGFTDGNLGSDNSGGLYDAFLAKFDSSGNLQWTQQIGTIEIDQSTSVAVDAAGNAYVTGHTWGSLKGTNAGSYDAFLLKFDTNGNELWREQMGTSSRDICSSVAVDAAGNVYISGYTDGNAGSASFGGGDAFLAKYSSSGNQLWIEQIGTSANDASRSVGVDAEGNAYISGYTEGSLGDANTGGWDVFLAKFDSSGSKLWTEQIGTSSNDVSYSVAVDAAGGAYVSGFTRGSLGSANAGDWDAFLTKFDSGGNELWTEQIGTRSRDFSYSVAIDGAGNAYISGETTGSLAGANLGDYDAFLIKYRIVPEPTAAVLAAVAGVAGLGVRRRG